ncbi:MAG TPA: hypothetical protein VFO76_05375 [Candidatus Kapabacteria bacterium]|nr:hypothetical protein [Candidatus Kapabacteria bacterium]
MKKIILASALGALTMFMWGAISWVALPWHKATLHSFSNEDAIIAVLKASNAESGNYMVPGYANSQEAMKAKAASGPVAHITYSPVGYDMGPMFYIKGIVLDFIILLIAVSMLSKISWSLASYSNRVKFMMMIGLVIGLSARLGDSIYMGSGIDFALVFAIDEVITWTLVGLVVAKFMKPALKAA